jgi:hypothetical protein
MLLAVFGDRKRFSFLAPFSLFIDCGAPRSREQRGTLSVRRAKQHCHIRCEFTVDSVHLGAKLMQRGLLGRRRLMVQTFFLASCYKTCSMLGLPLLEYTTLGSRKVAINDCGEGTGSCR